MYALTAAQQTSTEKFTVFFKRNQTQVRAVNINETKITTGKCFSSDRFGFRDNHELNNDKRILFWVFLQIHEPCFNP